MIDEIDDTYYKENFLDDLLDFMNALYEIGSWSSQMMIQGVIGAINFFPDKSKKGFLDWLKENAKKIKEKDSSVMEVKNNSSIKHILNQITYLWSEQSEDNQESIWDWLNHFVTKLKL